MWLPRSSQGRGSLGVSPAHCEVWGISGMSTSYSLGGSNDAVFHGLFCSNLLLLSGRIIVQNIRCSILLSELLQPILPSSNTQSSLSKH